MGRVLVGISFIIAVIIISLAEIKATPPSDSPPSSSDSIKTDLADYIWPTDAGRIVSSVFAEYRSSHFHGGIDISTGDNTGYKVFASRSGYVSRIVVGPSGYGKMLWLRHPDGYYTTYAHLRNFNVAIDAAVKKEQLRLQRYPITIDCNPSDFPVQKGEVIAFTGETGTGSPHLHFEIRDENKDFINPLLCKQFTFADDSIPRINKIALSPIGENSLIEGSFDSYIVSVPNPVRPSIALAETLHASGTFGFSVDARDRINFSRFHNGVYSHKLFLDDSLIYSVHLNRAPSTDDYQIGLYYDYGLMSEEEGRYEKLYMDSPNRLPFYQPRQVGAGIINTEKFPKGVHHFKIISSDFARNTTQVTGTIVFYQPYEISVAASNGTLSILPAPEDLRLRLKIFAKTLSKRKPAWKQYDISSSRQPFNYSNIARTSDVLKVVALDSLGSPSLPRFIYPRRARNATSGVEFVHQINPDYVRIMVKTKTQFSSPPYLVLSEGNDSRNIVLAPFHDDVYAGTFKPQEGFNGTRIVTMVNEKGSKEKNDYQINLYPLIPTRSAEIRFDNGNLIVNADSASMFRTTFMEIRKKIGSQNAYSLLPRFAIVDRGLTIKLRSENSSANEAIYFRGRSAHWSLLQTERSGNYLVAQLTKMLGDVAVMNDSKPPTVSRLSVPTRFKKQPHIISFHVSDNLSGVEYKELKLYIDDAFIVPVIDGEHRRVVNVLEQPLQRGSHVISIYLKDRMGNTQEVRRSFNVR